MTRTIWPVVPPWRQEEEMDESWDFPPPHSQEGCGTGFMDLLIQQEANFKHLEEILQNKSHEFVLPMKPG